MLSKQRNGEQNRLERKVEKILELMYPDQWKFVGNGKLIISGKIPDIVHKNKKVIIEVFGNYWHSEKFVGKPKEEHEKERINFFESNGYAGLLLQGLYPILIGNITRANSLDGVTAIIVATSPRSET